MKKMFLLFVLHFFNNYVVAQQDAVLLNLCENFNYTELKEGLTDLKSKSGDGVIYHFEITMNREVVNQYHEQIFGYTIENVDSEGYSSYVWYEVELIKYENRLAFYRLSKSVKVKKDDDWVSQTTVLKTDSNDDYVNFKTFFKLTYGKEINNEELFLNNIEFGDHCGFGGSLTDRSLLMNSFVAEKDTAEVLNWLSSANVETQLYAIVGVLKLKKANVLFDDKVYAIIDFIAVKSGKANGCSGCSYGTYKISDLVSDIEREFN